MTFQRAGALFALVPLVINLPMGGGGQNQPDEVLSSPNQHMVDLNKTRKAQIPAVRDDTASAPKMGNRGTNRQDLGDDDEKVCVAHGTQTTDANFMSHFTQFKYAKILFARQYFPPLFRRPRASASIDSVSLVEATLEMRQFSGSGGWWATLSA